VNTVRASGGVVDTQRSFDRDRTGAMLILWYALTTFVGAALLFVVEPLVARRLLPLLGGAPHVWVTCVLFFQVALLAGYLYAHLVVRFVPRRIQPVLHGVLVATAWWFLPLKPPATAPDTTETFPVLWLLGQLASTLGLPFVVTSATAPLVQGWLGQSRHRHASDPYFLYAASNAGSLLALLAYPVFIEPNLPLGAQEQGWSRGFVLLSLLIFGCALHVLLGHARQESSRAGHHAPPPPPARTVVSWLALAALPSSLMLGVTSFATTDVAPVPLLWIVPLALYLISFIFAFMQKPLVAHETVMRWLPWAVGLVALLRVAEVTRPIWLVLSAHFAAFFVIALACHGLIACNRPTAHWLTLFYLVLSAGGVVGGAINAIAAPLLFSSLAEYPLALSCAGFVALGVHGWSPRQSRTWQEIERDTFAEPKTTVADVARALARDLMPAVVVAVLLVVVLFATRPLDDTWRMFLLAQVGAAVVAVALVYRDRPLRSGAVLAAVFLVPVVAARTVGIIDARRSFFAVHKVVDDPSSQRHLYVQGTTVHGLQATDPDRHRIPGAYFHRSGPAGDVLQRYHFRNAAMIGLGVGSLASYAEHGQHITFFEIDPDVVAVAENPSLFTYVRDARDRGATVDIVLGDARMTLGKERDGSFDLIVLDAYSSDVVPAHLLTTEALALYRSKLEPRGLILMNMSNRYLDLGMVVSALTHGAGWPAFERTDRIDTEDDRTAERQDGKAASRWIVLAESRASIDALALSSEWKPLPAPVMAPWTDDYVNLIACVRW